MIFHAAICAFAASFLIKSWCIPELFWLLAVGCLAVECTSCKLHTWCLGPDASGVNAKLCGCNSITVLAVQNLGSLEQVALEIDGSGGLSPGSGYGSGGFGSGNLTTTV